uniref:Uncharacterized protein n=1 Tax=Arion vulgaris TaxID=1028688 RepID=A0A0B6ZJ81_9EUPU
MASKNDNGNNDMVTEAHVTFTSFRVSLCLSGKEQIGLSMMECVSCLFVYEHPHGSKSFHSISTSR